MRPAILFLVLTACSGATPVDGDNTAPAGTAPVNAQFTHDGCLTRAPAGDEWAFQLDVSTVNTGDLPGLHRVEVQWREDGETQAVSTNPVSTPHGEEAKGHLTWVTAHKIEGFVAVAWSLSGGDGGWIPTDSQHVVVGGCQ